MVHKTIVNQVREAIANEAEDRYTTPKSYENFDSVWIENLRNGKPLGGWAGMLPFAYKVCQDLRLRNTETQEVCNRIFKGLP